MTKIRTLFVLLLASILLSACSFHGGPTVGATAIADYDQASLEKTFKYGVATEKDVLNKLGPPTQKNNAAGTDVWTYRSRSVVTIGVMFVFAPIHTTKTAHFYFNEKSALLEKIAYTSVSE